jgi:hypothetical protein
MINIVIKYLKFLKEGVVMFGYSKEVWQQLGYGKAYENYQKYQAQEKENEEIYETLQNSFLKQDLPKFIQAFAEETQKIQKSGWEQASFERTIVILSELQEKYQRLHSIGLDYLFRTQFNAQITPVIDNFFKQIDGSQNEDERFRALLNEKVAVYDHEQLRLLFEKYPGMQTSQQTKEQVFEFIKFLREETLK